MYNINHHNPTAVRDMIGALATAVVDSVCFMGFWGFQRFFWPRRRVRDMDVFLVVVCVRVCVSATSECVVGAPVAKRVSRLV